MNSLSKQKKSSRYTDIEASYKQVKNRRWKWNGILQIVNREQMQNYDLVYNVKRKNETGDCSTKWVSAKERKCLISLYSEFSSEFLPRDIDSFEISGESFEKDVEEAASRLALYIQEYYFTGSDRYGC